MPRIDLLLGSFLIITLNTRPRGFLCVPSWHELGDFSRYAESGIVLGSYWGRKREHAREVRHMDCQSSSDIYIVFPVH